jgi:hypothetical protein
VPVGRGDPDARGDRHGDVTQPDRRGQPFQHPVADAVASLTDSTPGHSTTNSSPAEAGDQVAAAGGMPEAVGDSDEQPVHRPDAVQVVDSLNPSRSTNSTTSRERPRRSASWR